VKTITISLFFTISLVLTSISYADYNLVDMSNVVAIWLFDEGSGTEVKDSSGNDHHGAFASGEPKWVDGRFNKALQFDGVDDWVQMDAPVVVDTVDFTMGCWVKPGDTQKDWANILSSHVHIEVGMTGISFEQSGDNDNLFGIAIGDGVNWAGAGAVQLTPNEWNHMAFVRKGDKGTWYLDGEVYSANNQLASADPVVASPFNFHIGSWAWCAASANPLAGREFNGIIDEAFIFERALSEDEIITIVNAGIMGEPSEPSYIFPVDKIATAWGKIKTQ
jgi:hypothetical protein